METTPETTPEPVRSFRDTEAWQAAQQLAVEMARLLPELPRNRTVEALCSPLINAAVLVPARLAEAHGHAEPSEHRKYLLQARSFAFECEARIELLRAAGYLNEERGQRLLTAYSRVEQLVGQHLEAYPLTGQADDDDEGGANA